MPKQTNKLVAAPPAQLGSLDSFRLMVDSIKDYAIIMLDPNGIVMTWNQGAQRIKGWSADEILGKHFSAFYPPEAVQRGFPEQELKTAVKDGRFEDDGWRVRKDGSRFWANVIVSPLYDKEGKLLGFGKVTRDLTEKQRSEKKFRDLLEGAPDALVITDAQGKIVLVNSQTEKMFGYRREELLGQPIEMLVPPRFREKHPAYRSEYVANPRVRPMGAGLRLFGLHKDGHEIPVEISLSPLETEEGTWTTSSIRDVTERRLNEERIQQQSREIMELSTPVMQVWQGVVAAPLIGSLDSQRTQQFMERLLSRIVETNSPVALVDIMGVPTIDTQTAQHLIETVSAVRLLGAQVVLTGVRPAIAQTLVHLGIDLSDIITRSSLAAGIQVALEILNLQVVGKGPKPE
jgi:rsbT co-antagonist protein RsbR